MPGTGGGDENAACEGFREWFDASNARASEVYALIDPVQTREVEDPATLRSISADIQAKVTEQRQSDPPPEAEKLNNLMVDIYGLWAQATMAASNRDIDSLQAYDAEYRELASQADTEDKRLRQACL